MIGIVASKLVDAFHRPAIVLSVEDGVAHGSCRSIPSFDMLGALERCAHLLHPIRRPQAGGGPDARTPRGSASCASRSTRSPTKRSGPDDLMPRLRIDGDLAFREITGGVAAGIASLAPFGAGNPRPVFAARGVEIIDGPRKLKERHLKMSLKQEGRIFRAVAWRAAERHDFLTEHKAALDVAFSLEQNQYNGEHVRRAHPGRPEELQGHSHVTRWQRTRPPGDRRVRRRVRGLRRARSWRRDPPPAVAADRPTPIPARSSKPPAAATIHLNGSARRRRRSPSRHSRSLRGRHAASCEGVTIVFDERKRQPHLHDHRQRGHASARAPATMVLDGAVKMEGSDGMIVLTEHAELLESRRRRPRARARST